METIIPVEKVKTIIDSNLHLDCKKAQVFHIYKELAYSLYQEYSKYLRIGAVNNSLPADLTYWIKQVSHCDAYGLPNAIRTLTGEGCITSATFAFQELCRGDNSSTLSAEHRYEKLLQDFNAGLEVTVSDLYSIYDDLEGCYCMDCSKSLLDDKFMQLHKIYKKITGE